MANLGGFHATYSGDEQTFLRLLESADHWLARHADVVIVGAAQSIKSTLDARLAGTARMPWSETVGLFLLAREDLGAPSPLAEISLAPVKAGPGGGDRARAALGFPAEGARRIVCELDPFWVAEGDEPGLIEGGAANALLGALTGTPICTSIEFRRAGATVALAAVDRLADAPTLPPAADPATATIPVRFATGCQSASPAVAARHNTAPLPAHGGRVEEFLALSARVVERSLRSGTQLIGATNGKALHVDDAALGVDDPLLSEVWGSLEDPQGAWAGVAIDVGDSYFFDHPLDHVPAVLLLEATCRLAAWACGAWPIGFDLSFPHFCELDRPVVLQLWASARHGALECRAIQNDRTVLRGRVQPSRPASAPPFIGARYGGAANRVEPGRVHKAHPHNVFVGPPQVSGGTYRCEVIVPEDSHTLMGGSQQALSPTVLIEGFRQIATLGAHELLNVELTRTMTQLSFHAALERNIAAGEPIVLELAGGRTSHVRDVEVARLTATVLAGEVPIGTLRSNAFLATTDVYARLRSSA
jgi:2-oxo-3-(phosphooxy)propyl 3-oxoalkanoate synthase